jgi:hypothetical protein
VRARLIALVLVACSSTPPKDTTLTIEQAQKLCRPSTDHLVELLTGRSTGGVPMADRLRTALYDRCANDRWGADAIDCFRALQTVEAADGCAKYLTVPQRDGFQQAIEGAAR